MKFNWIFLSCVGIMGIVLYIQSNKEGFQLQTQQAQFRNKVGHVFPVTLEVARTPAEIEQGLMHRPFLEPNTGMLFQFADEAPRSFWMRNTLVPLDMIFVTSTGRITNIIPSASPKTDILRHSSEPVQYVVELPGGTAEKWGIQAGDQFHF